MFTSSLFLPVSLQHFLVSISSSFSRASQFPFCFSGTSGERPGFPKKSGMGKTSVLSACWRQGPSPLCPRLHTPHATAAVAAPPQAVRAAGCPFSPSFTPHFPNGLGAAASLGTLATPGLQTSREGQHWLEDLLHMSTRSSWQAGAGPALQQVLAGLGWSLCTWTSSVLLAVGPRGTPVLFCAS